MKRMQLYTVWGCVILLLAFLFLTMWNDCRFNEERYKEVCEIKKRDSLEREQMERLLDRLNNVTNLLDSISCVQKDIHDTESRNDDSIKKSLIHLERIGQRMINLMK